MNRHHCENLPPAFAEAASRRQVTPLCSLGQLPARRVLQLGERPYGLEAKKGNYSSVALVAILGLTFYLRLLFFGQIIDADVGNVGYMGWRMAEGEVLIDLEGPGKPPLYSMLYALFVQSFGPSVLGLKMFGALFVLMAVISIYGLAHKAYGKEIGLLAALFFGVFSSGPMVEGGTVNLETLLHLPSILAIGFFLNGSISGKLRWYFLAGLCAAMATLVKQVGGVLFFAFFMLEKKYWIRLASTYPL